MKKKLISIPAILVFAFCILVLPKTIQGAGGNDVAINETNFPDETFRYFVSYNLDTDQDGFLSEAEADAYKGIDVSYGNIESLKGIEFLPNLLYLWCNNNALTFLDLSNNKELLQVECSNNKLTDLFVSNCTKLRELNCSNNQLTSLNVAGSSLYSLNVNNNLKLTYLNCNDCSLSSLNVTTCPALNTLYCAGNSLSTLDVSKNTALSVLFCGYNQLTSLNVANHSNLEALSVAYNSKLKTLECNNCALTLLNTGSCEALTRLNCSKNNLSFLDVMDHKKLYELYCSENNLSSLDFSANVELSTLDCSGNKLSYLDLEETPVLKDLDCYHNNISTLDISNCPYMLHAYERGNTYYPDENDWITYEYELSEQEFCYLCVDPETQIDTTPKPGATRIFGDNRYKTSMKIADRLKEVYGCTTFDTFILVSGQNFPDGLSASYLAAELRAPILTTDGKASRYGEINKYIRNNTNDNYYDDTTIYIIGGENAIPDEAVADLLDFVKKENIIRISGKDRYETNYNLLKATKFTKNGEMLIATGTAFPDSLSVSSTGLPLLLVNGKKDTLNAQQQEILKAAAKAGCTFTIIGGTSAISEAMQAAIEKCTGKKTYRIFGSTRYTTSAAIARRFFTNANEMILGYGENFPDALCAGPLGAALSAPVVLTNSAKTSAVNAAKDLAAFLNISKGEVLGGTTLISDDAVRSILRLVYGVKILVR